MIAAMNATNPNIRLDKRELILTKGSEVMLRRGYHGTGVQEIVQAAGIPKGSFYHYFASKEDFAVHALEHLYAPRLQRYASALSNPAVSPRERILSFYGELLNHFRRQEKPQYHCFIGSLSFEMAEPSQPIGLQVESILQRSVDILAQCLKELGRAQMAREVLDQLLQLDPGDGLALAAMRGELEGIADTAAEEENVPASG